MLIEKNKRLTNFDDISLRVGHLYVSNFKANTSVIFDLIYVVQLLHCVFIIKNQRYLSIIQYSTLH